MKNEEILKICGEHWRKILGLGKNTPDIETLCRQMCGNYCRQISSKIDNNARLACIFEKTVFDFFSQCFNASFGIFWIDEEKYPDGFKNLDKLTPDIIITTSNLKEQSVLAPDIDLHDIRMVIECTTASPKESMKKAWKDAFKYENCRGELIKHSVAVGFVSLHGLPPKYLRKDGESKIKNEGYGKDIPDYLDNNRWTYTGFLKVTDKENNPRPWWYWVSNVPMTESMRIPTAKGVLISPEYDKSLLGTSPLLEIYNVMNGILCRNGNHAFQTIPQENLLDLKKDYMPSDWTYSAPVSAMVFPAGYPLGEQLIVESESWKISDTINIIRKRKNY